MKVLIVFAHPEPKSFNGALKDQAVSTLKQSGHEVQVSDLYRLEWKAALDGADFIGPRLDPDYLGLSAEQVNMHSTSGPTGDVRIEQEKLLWCDTLIFQFPMWWFSMPAILKGWVDRTMTRGFAYGSGCKYDTGMLAGRRAMICTTTGSASSLYEPDGIDGDIRHILWPIHNGILRYVGFEVLPPYVAWMPGQVPAAQRRRYLDDYADRLRHLNETTPLYFHQREDYGPDERLKPDVAPHSGFQWHPGAGRE